MMEKIERLIVFLLICEKSLHHSLSMTKRREDRQVEKRKLTVFIYSAILIGGILGLLIAYQRGVYEDLSFKSLVMTGFFIVLSYNLGKVLINTMESIADKRDQNDPDYWGRVTGFYICKANAELASKTGIISIEKIGDFKTMLLEESLIDYWNVFEVYNDFPEDFKLELEPFFIDNKNQISVIRNIIFEISSLYSVDTEISNEIKLKAIQINYEVFNKRVTRKIEEIANKWGQ